MALAVKDRVKETTTTTGTGTYTLAGAVTGFETFGSVGNSNTTYYCCTDGTNFEVGIGTYTASGTTLARTTILQSSNSDSAVNWSAGTRTIFCTYPADKAVFKDASDDVTLKSSDGAILKLQSSDTTITDGSVLGAIEFSAPDEASGTDAILTSASIVAEADATFAADANNTDLVFKLGASEAAAEKMRLTHEGTLEIPGNADIDGTLEADAITVDGTALATYIRDTVGTNMLSSNTESGITVTYDTTNDNIDFSVDAAQTGITSLLATDIKIGEDDETKIDFETADEIHFYANNVSLISLTNANSGDAVLTVPTADKNFTIAGTDGSSGITALDIDMAAAGDATFNNKIIAVELDISGDVDVDGTLEADAITVDGTTLAEYISDTAGAMFSSNTETGITVTYQDADNTIDVAIDAAQTTITSLLATDIKIGEDDQTKIDFETADTINFYAGNEKQLILTDGALTPGTNAILDLGTDALEFKDAYFDGTVEADAITVGGTALNTVIANEATALAIALG